jgi:hypothetical protein
VKLIVLFWILTPSIGTAAGRRKGLEKAGRISATFKVQQSTIHMRLTVMLDEMISWRSASPSLSP